MTVRNDKQVKEIFLNDSLTNDCLMNDYLTSNYSLIDNFNKIDLYLTQFVQYWQCNLF